MGVGEEHFVPGLTISDNLKCSMCMCVFEDPVSACGQPCHCTFCRACITTWLAQHGSCPNDRGALSASALQRDVKIQRFVDELQVVCERRAQGCYWTGRFDARPAHEAECLALRTSALEGKLQEKDNAIAALSAKLDARDRSQEQLQQVQDLGLAAPAVRVNPPGDAGGPAPTAATPLPRGRLAVNKRPPQDRLQRVTREGGRRGAQIEDAATAGGLQFYCTSVQEPRGDIQLLLESLKAMNAPPEHYEEVRLGGSKHIGKMIFSAGAEHLAVVAYLPEDELWNFSCQGFACEDWLRAVVAIFGGNVLSASPSLCTGMVAADAAGGVLPRRICEPMILEANGYLREKGLLAEDTDLEEDEIIFTAS